MSKLTKLSLSSFTIFIATYHTTPYTIYMFTTTYKTKTLQK